MWGLASGNLVLVNLNICLKTPYPCGYNYSHLIKEVWGDFIRSLNKEGTAPELSEIIFLKYTPQPHTCTISDFLFFWSYLTISLSLIKSQEVQLWPKRPVLITSNTGFLGWEKQPINSWVCEASTYLPLTWVCLLLWWSFLVQFVDYSSICYSKMYIVGHSGFTDQILLTATDLLKFLLNLRRYQLCINPINVSYKVSLG